MVMRVLGFHQIADQDHFALGPEARYRATPKELELAIENYHSWNFVDLSKGFSRRLLQANQLLLTFDDGYRDFHSSVLPILERYDVPAVVFVVPGFADGVAFPVELAIAEALTQARCETPRPEYARLRALVTHLSPNEQIQVLSEEFDTSVPIDRCIEKARDQMLQWSEIVELSQHPLVTVGTHSYSHPKLAAVSRHRVFQELKCSRDRMLEVLGAPVTSMAYPYGSHNRSVRKAADYLGYRCAFTTRPLDLYLPIAACRMRIPRFCFDRARLAGRVFGSRSSDE